MKSIRSVVFTLFFTSVLVQVLAAQTSDKGDLSDDLIAALMTSPEQNISSTASGGNWSSPSTWVGGAVPTNADSVTITAGATVVVDTSAEAGSVTVGTAGSLAGGKRLLTEGGPAARLTFQETTGRTLTIANSLSIESDGVFSTGAGTVDFHTVSIGGNLTNKGTLDLSTNGGLAGAALDFTGNSNATFGGTGAVTDISRILMNKASFSNTVELSVSNFTVKGSTTDGPASAYLFLFGGVFKISGTFTGSHRTLQDAYETTFATGFWLNNPNYTVTARPAAGRLNGLFRLSAGEFNVGTETNHVFVVRGIFIVEGGRLNAAGRFFVYAEPELRVSGGKVTTCMTGGPGCDVWITAWPGTAVTLSGGEIVLQNSGVFNGSFEALSQSTVTPIRFGNELTSGPGDYGILGFAPNVVIDTSSGSPQTLVTEDVPMVQVMNLEIQAGGLFRFYNLSIHGTSVVNNGQLESLPVFSSGKLEFDDLTGLSDITYSGMGSMSGTARAMNIRCRTMTFDQTGGNLFAYSLKVTKAHLVNAGRITLGRHDSTQTWVEVYDGASFDATPDFDLGPAGQKNIYKGTNNIGPEINSSRALAQLTFIGPGTLTLTGSDMAAARVDFENGGVIKTGDFTFSTQVQWELVQNGYFDGNLRMQFVPGHLGHNYLFPVGQNGSSPVKVGPASITGASALTIRAVDMTLPGLDPAASASRYWTITEEGSIVAQLTFNPTSADINGNPANYIKWRSNGGTPVQVVSGNIDQLTGDWGLGERLAPTSVSISGSVTTSTGQPIRNALLTISGGGLPNPITTSTGSFGTYLFQNVPINHVYTVRVDAKRYRFTPISQEVNATNNVANVNFTANPQE